MAKTIKKGIEIFFVMLVLSLATSVGVCAKSDFVIKKVGREKATPLLKNNEKITVLLQYTGNDSKVVIPKGVQFIEGGAFKNNKKVEEIVLPNTVLGIGEYTFSGCTKLKKINIPQNVKRIWTGAFAHCKKLKTITLNKNLKVIDEFAFMDCEGLKKIKLKKGNNFFKVYKGALYSKKMNKLIIYPISKKGTKYTISPKVKTIEGYAFSKNKYLKTIIIKGSVKFGEGSFVKAKSLKKVVFEKAYRWAPEFRGCKKLEKVVLAEGTKVIGESQFKGCKNLKNINFPKSLKYIDMYAFSGCYKITKPVFSNNVEIDKKAFD